jgi:hypothetical protein
VIRQCTPEPEPEPEPELGLDLFPKGIWGTDGEEVEIEEEEEGEA